eukprot:scaffold34982_cov27-Tisochrysis_lutea.AAC.1
MCRAELHASACEETVKTVRWVVNRHPRWMLRVLEWNFKLRAKSDQVQVSWHTMYNNTSWSLAFANRH